MPARSVVSHFRCELILLSLLAVLGLLAATMVGMTLLGGVGG